MGKENIKSNLKVVLFGSVSSSYVTLKKLIEHNIDVVGVFGVQKYDVSNLSGYVNLQTISEDNCIPFFPFEKVKESRIKSQLEELEPDIIFVIGLSQLFPNELINIAPMGAVGFHPTDLPRGRGRAPIAWLILKEKKGAANFFKITEGIDDGHIYIQEKFDVVAEDDASSVEQKIIDSIEVALDRWLPKLFEGELEYYEQEKEFASYYEKRFPIDGVIEWQLSALTIKRLISATTRPYPGAYTFFKDKKLIIWKAVIIENYNVQGVVGRVVRVEDGNPIIQTGEGHLKLVDYELMAKEDAPKLIVGSRLGYYNQVEINKLITRVEKLENIVKEIVK